MIEEGLVKRLIADADVASLVSGQKSRVFPSSMPQRATGDESVSPSIVYRRTSSSRDSSFCSTDNLVQSTFQFDSYANNYEDARKLGSYVRKSLLDFSGLLTDDDQTRVDRIFLSSSFDLEDPDPGLYRVSQSFVVWYFEEE